MISNKVLIGIVILFLGAGIGFFGAATPVTSAFQQTNNLVNTAISVAPNDYSTQSIELTRGETVFVALSIDNQTLFTLDIMNQSQYYVYYNCAPKCAQPLLGGNGSYFQQAREALPAQLNVSVTPASPYSSKFEAPANGTYYFLFDNTKGPNWSSYVGQNATGSTTGNFSLSSVTSSSVRSVNWSMVGLGAAITFSGGITTTVTWNAEPKKERAK